MADPSRHPLRQLLNRVDDDALRRRALTHSGWAPTHGESYERLEFLGDAALGLAIGAELFRRFPDRPEGELSRIRAATVSRGACADVARDAALGPLMRETAPAEADARLLDEFEDHERVLAALTESVIGACYLALPVEDVLEAVVASFEAAIAHAVSHQVDAKSRLQEYAQARGDRVAYEVLAAEGPDHERSFTIRARLLDGGREAVGTGKSKKVAEQAAATELLQLVRG